jgi:integrase
MRRTLTDKGVIALKPRAERYALPDPQMVGHYVRVQPTGSKTFVAVARNPGGRQVWTAIGAADVMSITEAREAAREVIKRIRAGLPAVETKPDSVAAVVENWLKRHLEAEGRQHLPTKDPARYRLRSQREIRRMLNSHILPAWRDREFIGIRRSDITKLMDRVQDKHGARAADYVLNVFSSIANWHASRVDDYVPPIARGMKRQSTKAQARTRILDDGELAAIWKASENAGKFGAFVRLSLLTGQRRTRVAEMKWSEIDADGLWTLPIEPREKENGGKLRLPEAALAIIRGQPRIGENPYVFPGRDRDGYLGPFKGLGQAQAVMIAGLPDMPRWVLHDLRRTARSLMSRAGVRPDIAERVLGHAIVGVEGTYNRYAYEAEKGEALAALAALIRAIVDPPAADNVVPMVESRERRQ